MPPRRLIDTMREVKRGEAKEDNSDGGSKRCKVCGRPRWSERGRAGAGWRGKLTEVV